jgi:hypothetical protein
MSTLTDNTFETVVAVMSIAIGGITAAVGFFLKRAEREADEDAQQAERARDAAVTDGPRTRDELVGEWGAVKLGALRRNAVLSEKVFQDIRRLPPPRRRP